MKIVEHYLHIFSQHPKKLLLLCLQNQCYHSILFVYTNAAHLASIDRSYDDTSDKHAA